MFLWIGSKKVKRKLEKEKSDFLKQVDDNVEDLLFGDASSEVPGTLNNDYRRDFRRAWAREAVRVATGFGSRQWTLEEQEELLTTSRVAGYDVHHMKDRNNHPEWASDIKNMQFLFFMVI